MTVTIGDGLEESGVEAFKECISLERIIIPSAVKMIDDTAFKGCTNLTRVVFCDEIERFLSCKAMRGWWKHGLHKNSLSTYRFLVRCSFPERFDLVLEMKWQANNYHMLSRIPTVSAEGLNAYFDSIDSKFTEYEHLSEAPILLDLAILNDDIILRVLSFI